MLIFLFFGCVLLPCILSRYTSLLSLLAVSHGSFHSLVFLYRSQRLEAFFPTLEQTGEMCSHVSAPFTHSPGPIIWQ